MITRLVSCLAIVFSVSCFEPRFVQLKNLDATLDTRPSLPWKAQLDEFARRYTDSPALTEANARFGPIFGGLSTLAYFGSDFEQKLLDQRIAADWRQVGGTLPARCELTRATDARAAVDAALASPSEPAFDPIWLPLPIGPEPLQDGTTCDERGKPSAVGHFCMFGRLALQEGTAAPLILIVHGMFDSSAQLYVRSLAATLFAAGYSTLLLDMRDHGDTFRAAPWLPTSLGRFEAGDILAVARTARAACAARVSAVGVAGVSGGGLDAITAYAGDGKDGSWALDAGAVAFSPLLHVDNAVENIGASNSCSTLNAIELTWQEHLALGVLTGAAAFLGAGIAAWAQHEELGKGAAIATGVGVVSGVGLGLLVDAFADGDSTSSQGCVGRSAIAGLFDDVLRERWRTLTARGAEVWPPKARKIAPEDITFADYLSQRVDAYYAAHGGNIVHAEPRLLSELLRARTTRPGDKARLMVLGADDDPVTLQRPLHDFQAYTSSLPNVYVGALAHGGHGAFWVVQQQLTSQVFRSFFRPAP